MLSYRYGDVEYVHDIRVEEFQKPSFSLESELEMSGSHIGLSVAPRYYFGSSLGSYDIEVERSLSDTNSCRDCRWWNEEEYYFNYLFGVAVTEQGRSLFQGVQSSSVRLDLLDSNELSHQ